MPILLLLISIFSSFAFGVTIEIPPINWSDDIISPDWDTIIWETTSWMSLMKQANEYVWFALFLVAMIMLIVWWYWLITAEWDSAYLKKANKLVVYGLVWIVISVSSYFIVKLLVNMF